MLGMIAGDVFAGEMPEPPPMRPQPTPVPGEGISVTQSAAYVGTQDPEWRQYEEGMEAYFKRWTLVNDVTNLLSPQSNYRKVAMAVTNPRYAALVHSPFDPIPEETPGLADALGQVWMNIAALVVFPLGLFCRGIHQVHADGYTVIGTLKEPFRRGVCRLGSSGVDRGDAATATSSQLPGDRRRSGLRGDGRGIVQQAPHGPRPDSARQ